MRRSVVFCERPFTSELPLRVLTVCSTRHRHQRPPRRSSGQRGDVPIDDVRAQQLGLELFIPLFGSSYGVQSTSRHDSGLCRAGLVNARRMGGRAVGSKQQRHREFVPGRGGHRDQYEGIEYASPPVKIPNQERPRRLERHPGLRVVPAGLLEARHPLGKRSQVVNDPSA